VFEYLSQFTRWRPYEHRVLASVDGKLVTVGTRSVGAGCVRHGAHSRPNQHR
jgi:hypothetical protein